MAPHSPDSDSQRSERKENFWVLAARYTQLALALPAGVLVGWLLGSVLDRWLHTTWLYLVGMGLGIVAGFVELIRTALRDSK
jgi:ATP synthase protein I